MIERYTLPEMGRVWSDAHKYELWCRVEVLVLEAQARAGTVPAESVEPVRSAQSPTPEAVAAVEAVTDHDVIAFLTAWADNTEPRSAAAWVHYGMTSSDLLDTALAVQLAEASDLLIAKATALVDFFSWDLSTGQDLLANINYAPLGKELQAKSVAQLKKLTVNGAPLVP